MEYLVFITILTLVNGATIINGPQSTAGKLGDTVELICEAYIDQDILEWRYFPEGDTTGVRIWISGGDVLATPFEVHQEGNSYKLVIKALSEELSRLYTCKLLVKDDVAEAKVTALDNFHCLPTWDPPPMPPSPPKIVQGAEMVFTCSVKYTGDIKPKLEWYRDDVPVNTKITDENGIITGVANVTAKADLDEVPFECRLMFGYLDNGSPGPQYMDQCSTYYQVIHAATNIQTYPEYTGTVLPLEIGSIINCSASGRPTPSITWRDKDTYEQVIGPRLEITPELAGEHTWICKAENTILGNPRYAEREVRFKAEGYATDSPYQPTPPAKASVQGWVIAIAVIIPLIVIVLVIFLGFYCVKKRKGKGTGGEKNGIPPDTRDQVDPLMQQPVPKPRDRTQSQDSGVVTATEGPGMIYRPGSQGQIYKPRSQGQINRQASQGPQMYRPPSQDRLDQSANPMYRPPSQDGLDQGPGNPQIYRPGAQVPSPMMYRSPSQERLDDKPQIYRGPSQDQGSNLQMVRRGSQDNLDRGPQMYRTPSQDRLESGPGGPQPAPRTKLSKSKENLATQEPVPKPRGSRGSIDSLDQPLSGYGLMGDPMKKSHENLAGSMDRDTRPKTLPKPTRSREDLTDTDPETRSGPPTLPKPKNMQQKLGVQVLPPPPQLQKQKSLDTEV